MGLYWSESKQINDENSMIQACKGRNVSNCHQLLRLKQMMSVHGNIIDKINILQTLNDHLHLMQFHDNNDEFEVIFNILGYCDITKCNIFKRRNNSNIVDVGREIMDKIHCYYQHCFDIGNKLLIQEEITINNNNEDAKSINDEDAVNQYLIDTKLVKLNQILSSKRKTYNDLTIISNKRINKKYNQFLLLGSNKINNEIYSFGFPFNYGYSGEEIANFMSISPITVTAKYSSLKQELTTNRVSTLSIQQFNNEYEKTKIHYDSDYCKQTLLPRNDEYNKNTEWIFSIKYLLSLMIYCNHTSLQFEFSKTYRICDGIKHNEYYHLGKYLKIVVHKFGTAVIDGNVKSFYHGISEQLIFEEYISDWTGSLHINCPLSTSSSFVVATNFTNNNNGLIVEFGGGGILHEIKYFSVSWLSDFGNENEYLFIQNAYNYSSLKINNIFDMKYGFQYNNILNSLRILDVMVIMNKRNLYLDLQHIFLEDLLKQIIASQLHSNQSFNVFNQYSINIINSYFNNKTYVNINYEKIKNYNISWLFDILCFAKYDWIKLKEINILFPNIESIILIMSNIRLTPFIMDNILSHLSGNNKTTKLKQIQISNSYGNTMPYIDHNTDSLNKQIVSKYQKRFKQIMFDIKYQANVTICDNIFHVNGFSVEKIKDILQKDC